MKTHDAQLYSFLTGALDVGWVFSLVPQQVNLQDLTNPALGGPRASHDALEELLYLIQIKTSKTQSYSRLQIAVKCLILHFHGHMQT
jgi:hypothetical protein